MATFMWSIRPHIQFQWWNPWSRFEWIWPHLTPGIVAIHWRFGLEIPRKKMNDEAKSYKIIILDNCLVFLESANKHRFLLALLLEGNASHVLSNKKSQGNFEVSNICINALNEQTSRTKRFTVVNRWIQSIYTLPGISGWAPLFSGTLLLSRRVYIHNI